MLQTLVGPLRVYLEERDDLLMVSGFAGDKAAEPAQEASDDT